MKQKPVDPITEEEYIYSTIESRWEYEVLVIYEWWIGSNTLINKTHAADTWYVKVDGTYNQLYVGTSSFVIPVPSLITSEELPITLDGTNIKSQVVTAQLNRPSRGNTVVQTWWLDIVLSVYTGSIKKTSTDQAKQDAIIAIQWAYSGTLLSNNEPYEYLLSQVSSWELLTFANISILNDPSWWTLSSGEWLTWWRALDPNCDIDDITIGSQVWAWCNSTLWNGFEWWKQDNGSNGTVSNGCYNYSGTDNATCTIGDTSMASNTKANTWFTGSNVNGDTEVANIWWKLYTWMNSDSACGTWYHVPSNAEWETLETTLYGSNCRNSIEQWLCDGLWWKFHDTKSSSNNIVQALKIPLAGSRDINGIDFGYRGESTQLWSSTPETEFSAYFKDLYWDDSTLDLAGQDLINGFSIRCIKD